MTDPHGEIDDDALEQAAGGFDMVAQVQCPTCGKFNCGKH